MTRKVTAQADQFKPGNKERAVWIFQAVPGRFDLLKEFPRRIRAGDWWTVSRFRNEMRQGDLVLFWKAGPLAGIYGTGELKGKPYSRRGGWRVDVSYNRLLPSPIFRSTLLKHRPLRNLSVIRQPHGANFRVKPSEWRTLRHYIAGAPILLAVIHNGVGANAHHLFQRWRRGHRQAPFLAVHGKRAMLHVACCHHFESTARKRQPGWDLAKHKKVLGGTVSDLGDYASEQKLDLIMCSHCLPGPHHLADPQDGLNLVRSAGGADVGGAEIDYAKALSKVTEEGAHRSTRDAREFVQATIVLRRGQPGFRGKLMALYEGRCVITGCDAAETLEAAHIYPYRGKHTDQAENGLLLRADLHTLFDLRLIAIDTTSMRVLLAPHLRSTSYGSLHGKQPCWKKALICKKALDHHRKLADL